MSGMAKVPEGYFQFVMDYAPYVYVVPGLGPDPEWGRAAFTAAFAVDFLFEAYFDPQFDARSGEIEAKIVELADWVLTQQCTDSETQAYGGFKSAENSTSFYSVDACRTVPALLKAYELTSNTTYMDSAALAAGTFLYNMQHKSSELGVHDRYHGGFARAVTLEDAWQADSGFDWSHIKKVRVTCWFDGAGTGAFWVDGLFFGGRRYSAVAEDSGSQAGYGLRELVEVDEELWSDAECVGRAEALLANQKDPAESLTVRSTVLDYGGSPILAGDKVHVALPNEGVDADFRVLSVEYNVDAATQTLETVLELGREAPMLADYVYALRSKTDSLSRYKVARA